MNETEKKDHLLPVRHPQVDLFICDVADAVLKDDMASMEHPFYSLSKKPDIAIREYEHKGKKIKITPSAKGLATIYDKDILIYCISQMIAKMKLGEEPKKELVMVPQEVLQFCNRRTGGREYELLIDSLERLTGTMITTNIPTGDEVITEIFTLLDKVKIRRSEKTDRIQEVRITLGDWVFNSIKSHEVLTLHPHYFRLRRPIERRVYEIARKHCGQQDSWQVGIDLLKKKCGSRASMKEFNRLLKDLVEGDHLPDYSVTIEKDKVIFKNREKWWENGKPKQEYNFPILDPETFNDAKTVAPSYDVYYLEQDWRDWWVDSGCPPLVNPDKAFIGFCKRRYERNPTP